MEKVSCILCGGSETRLAYAVKDRLEVTSEPFSIVRCQRCGLLFLNPRPTKEEIGRYYPYTEYKDEFAPAVQDEPSLLHRLNRLYHMEKMCRSVERVKGEGRLLDVGCATGNFLDRMWKRGNWQVWGVEVNEEAARYAQERFGLDVFIGELREANYPASWFDVVALWDVLEHLHDPLDTLKEINRVLKGDGILILSLPNSDSFDARIFGDCWIGLDPPRHLYTFSTKTLKRLLTVAGFEATETRFIIGSYHSFTASLGLVVSNSTLAQNRKAILQRIVASVPIHLLSLPYLRATEWLERGAILTMYARKAMRQRA
jgi:2-polyprenyl-3-methyl-5-hydroxy-6-metoxy-1,4-benzoquinol methylase